MVLHPYNACTSASIGVERTVQHVVFAVRTHIRSHQYLPMARNGIQGGKIALTINIQLFLSHDVPFIVILLFLPVIL